ncbi:unnamed protein product [Heligmosomoides polygyrus]|uniref:peptidylamidoglycolate lyase n=1 Tax=Heligmosomoides polygyrus TaxID=6339 RepID=A0A3P8B8T1_HELPZ|nr:unnamed protein product [Heligmosomoides polygyrus]
MQADLLLLFGLFALTWAAPKPSVDDESRLYDLSNEGEMPTVEENVHENAAESEEENEAFILPVSKALGEISGLAIDKKGRLVAFHRADREWDASTFNEKEVFNKKLGPIKNATIAVIDASNGNVIEEKGQNMFYMPHGITIDEKGNYWVTDVGSHQVHKLDSTFHPVLSLGEKLVPGNDAFHFCKPTDIAVAKNGYFFVADGYCNSRVLKFDPSGKLVDSFGAAGDELGPSEFVVPHSLALIEDMNLICVADRENERVQCFSAGLAEGHRTIPAGIPITSAEQLGRVYAIREKKHYLVGVTGRDDEDQLPPQMFGIENAHSLAISDEGTVFISQMHPNQIVQISLPDQA